MTKKVQAHKSPATGKAHKPTAEKERSVGAPELESPEEPKVPQKATLASAVRTTRPPMETPEKPVAPKVKEVVEEPEEEGDASVLTAAKRVGASDVQVIAELAASGPTIQDSYVTFLFQHVSAHPVDAHAPAWAARTPNTTGGYS